MIWSGRIWCGIAMICYTNQIHGKKVNHWKRRRGKRSIWWCDVCLYECLPWLMSEADKRGFPLGRVEMKSNFVECIHMNLFNELVSRISSCSLTQRWCVCVCDSIPFSISFLAGFSSFWFRIYFDKFSDCSILMAWKMRKTSEFRYVCLFLFFSGSTFFPNFIETNVNIFSNTCRLTNLRFLLLYLNQFVFDVLHLCRKNCKFGNLENWLLKATKIHQLQIVCREHS